jgi:hypothetical protein
VRLLAWIQGALAVVNLVAAAVWLYEPARTGCGGFPLFVGLVTVFIAGVLAAGGMWSLVYLAGRKSIV